MDLSEQVPELPPFHRRILDVFFSPGRLCEALAEHPRWGLALALGAVLVVGQYLLIPADIWDATFRDMVLQQGREMPEGFGGGGTLMRLSGLIGGFVFWFVFSFLMAGVVTLIFAFVLGDEGRYRQYLAVLAHAWLIPAFVGLLLVPVRITARDPQLTLNLGSFLLFLPDGYWLKVATMLDLTQLWAWVVVAVGAHAIDEDRSVKSAAIILLVFSVALALAFAPLAPG